MNTTVKLGDREITRVGLGTNRLTHTRANVDFIQAAIEAGVQMIDSARLYTGGDSEKTIGEATSGKPGQCVIATKGGFGGAGRGKSEVLRTEIEPVTIEQIERARKVVPIAAVQNRYKQDPATPAIVRTNAKAGRGNTRDSPD